jgi:hypothetical protein
VAGHLIEAGRGLLIGWAAIFPVAERTDSTGIDNPLDPFLCGGFQEVSSAVYVDPIKDLR